MVTRAHTDTFYETCPSNSSSEFRGPPERLNISGSAKVDKSMGGQGIGKHAAHRHRETGWRVQARRGELEEVKCKFDSVYFFDSSCCV